MEIQRRGGPKGDNFQGGTGGLLSRVTEHKRATRNGDVNNHIAEHHLKMKHQIDWDSATCITYSTDYYQRLTLESWFTNLEQTPLNRSQQLPAPYKRLIDEMAMSHKLSAYIVLSYIISTYFWQLPEDCFERCLKFG